MNQSHDIFSPCPLFRKDDSAIDRKVECICNYTFHAESHIGDKSMLPEVKIITQDHKVLCIALTAVY